jgi:hypothetical protein
MKNDVYHIFVKIEFVIYVKISSSYFSNIIKFR